MPLDIAVVNDLRKRVLENQPYTREEIVKNIREMISDRITVMTEGKPKKTKAAKTKESAISLDDLL